MPSTSSPLARIGKRISAARARAKAHPLATRAAVNLTAGSAIVASMAVPAAAGAGAAPSAASVASSDTSLSTFDRGASAAGPSIRIADVELVAARDGAGAAALDWAIRNAQGKRYKYGGNGPNAYDCSGLIVRAFAAVGVTGLPRTAAGLSKVGRPVSREDIQPGDLIFYAPRGRVSHVAFYAGNGRDFDASTSSKPVGFGNAFYRGDGVVAIRRIG